MKAVSSHGTKGGMLNVLLGAQLKHRSQIQEASSGKCPVPNLTVATGEIIQVSAEDIDFLSNYSWSLTSGGYVHGLVDGHIKYMHRVIIERMGFGSCEQVDHDDRNKLNNQRSNLKPSTATLNQRNKGIQTNNRSGYPGVSYNARTGKWQAFIKIARKSKNLGGFATPEEASEAYQRAKRLFHATVLPSTAES